jgi:hypothetical protein
MSSASVARLIQSSTRGSESRFPLSTLPDVPGIDATHVDAFLMVATLASCPSCEALFRASLDVASLTERGSAVACSEEASVVREALDVAGGNGHARRR